MSRRFAPMLLLALASILLVGAFPASVAAQEMSDYERAALEEDRSEYQLLKGFSIAGLVVGSGLTVAGSYGIARAAAPCQFADEFDCTQRRVVAGTLGGTGVLLGLTAIVPSIVGIVWSNSKLRTINQRLSFDIRPHKRGASALLEWRF